MVAPLVAGLAVAGAMLLLLGPRRAAPARVHDLGARRTRSGSSWVAPLLRSRPVAIWRDRREEKDRRAAVNEALPDTVDLLHLAACAGLTARLAVEVVSDLSEGPLAEVLDQVRMRVVLGEPLADALEALLALGDPVRPLHQALLSAARDGTPLVAPLERVGDEARSVRRRRAEERARRLPVQLLFPLVLCILPAFGLLTVVPLLAGALGSLPR
jgi:tight adherence protein C